MTSPRSDGWSDFELQCLYDVINDGDWFRHASRLIVRSEGAIRTKMSALRAAAGIVVKHAGHHPRPEPQTKNDAITGSQELRARIFAVHAPRRVSAPEPEPHREAVQLDFLPGPLFDWRAAA